MAAQSSLPAIGRDMLSIVVAIAYISGLVIVLATIVLAFENRNSPETIKSTGVIVGGVAISLITMYLSFQSEHTKQYFSTTLLVNEKTGIPVQTTLAYIHDSFPEYSEILWHDESVRRGFRIMFKNHPGMALNLYAGGESKPDWGEFENRYADIVFDQGLGQLLEKFGSGWNVEVREFKLFGRQALGSIATKKEDTKSDATILAGKDLLGKLQFFSPVFEEYDNPMYELYLPPSSKLVAGSIASSRSVAVSNPFVDLKVSLSSQGAMVVHPESRVLRNLAIADGQEYRAIIFDVEIERTFKGLRLGHPKMQEYRDWTDQFVDCFRSILDDTAFWKAIASPLLPPPPEGYGVPPSIKESNASIAPVTPSFEVESLYYDDKLTSDELEGLGEIVLRIASKGVQVIRTESWDSMRKSEELEAEALLRALKTGRVITIVSPDARQSEVASIAAVLADTCARVPEFSEYSISTVGYNELAKIAANEDLKNDLLKNDKDSPTYIFVAHAATSQSAEGENN